jgi:hypothetical protein
VEGFSEATPDLQLTVARISVLAEFAKFAPDVFESKSDVIMTVLLKQVLMVPTSLDSVSSLLYPVLRYLTHMYKGRNGRRRRMGAR